MSRPENSYTVTLPSVPEKPVRMVWRTVENGTEIDYTTEPARHPWQRIEVKVLSLLPLDDEL
jgi:cardiolipin synthase C